MNEFTQEEYEELSSYVYMENTSITNYLSGLLCLNRSDEQNAEAITLERAVNAELRHWLNRFRNETEIIEVTESVPDVTYKKILWIGYE